MKNICDAYLDFKTFAPLRTDAQSARGLVIDPSAYMIPCVLRDFFATETTPPPPQKSLIIKGLLTLPTNFIYTNYPKFSKTFQFYQKILKPRLANSRLISISANLGFFARPYRMSKIKKFLHLAWLPQSDLGSCHFFENRGIST